MKIITLIILLSISFYSFSQTNFIVTTELSSDYYNTIIKNGNNFIYRPHVNYYPFKINYNLFVNPDPIGIYTESIQLNELDSKIKELEKQIEELKILIQSLTNK